MVLQRDAQVSIWGWSDKEEVRVKASWIADTISVKTDLENEGKWMIKLSTNHSLESRQLYIEDDDASINLKNILFGEVWICSGQSNMAQPVAGYLGQPTYGALETMTKADNQQLRLFKVESKTSEIPLTNLDQESKWMVSNSATVGSFSAVGYHFANQLQEILHCPVGIIQATKGASPVEAWMSQESIKAFKEIEAESENSEKKAHKRPSTLFNAMIVPIIPYSLKGILWYQGEGNRLNPDLYLELFPNMVADWRNRWDQGEFPFYFTQIAPFSYWGQVNAYTKTKNSAFMRETQLQCAEIIPNSAITITMDLGDSSSIHPPRKREVADRLLYLALNNTYGYDHIPAYSPKFKSFKVLPEGRCSLSFENAPFGLYAPNGIKDFEIAGADHVFYPAKAKIVDRRKIEVSSEEVDDPKAVRYAWSNWVKGSLYNTFMIPMSSFRTDTWEDATRMEE